MYKRMLALFLAFTVVFSSMSIVTFAQEDKEGENDNSYSTEADEQNTDDTPINWSGSGTVDDPYLITNKQELEKLANDVNNGEGYRGISFKQTDSIETLNVQIGDENHPFQGTYDGADHVIKLEISSKGHYTGLFGANSGTIKNVATIGKFSIDSGTGKYTGGICALNSGTIMASCNGAKLDAQGTIGGVCAENNGRIDECTNIGKISGSENISGICAENKENCTIINCSNYGSITSGKCASGICGYNEGKIVNSCNLGVISSIGSRAISPNGVAGGLCAYNREKGVIKNSYNASVVSAEIGSKSVGAICGSSGAESENFSKCYWNTDLKNTAIGEGKGEDYCSPYNTSQCKDGTLRRILDDGTDAESKKWTGTVDGYPVVGKLLVGVIISKDKNIVAIKELTSRNDFEDEMDNMEEGTYEVSVPFPGIEDRSVDLGDNGKLTIYFDFGRKLLATVVGRGLKKEPYLIETEGELSWIGNKLKSDGQEGKYFKQVKDIGDSATGVDFVLGGQYEIFGGIYDGNNYSVYSKVSTKSEFTGLFANNAGELRNIKILGSIKGGNYVGAICGYNIGTIENCSACATIEGGADVGGICGCNQGAILNCYNADTVTSSFQNVGGICGYSEGTIENCYNCGRINWILNEIGAVCGCNEGSEESIKKCYWDGLTSNCAKGIGKGPGTTMKYAEGTKTDDLRDRLNKYIDDNVNKLNILTYWVRRDENSYPSFETENEFVATIKKQNKEVETLTLSCRNDYREKVSKDLEEGNYSVEIKDRKQIKAEFIMTGPLKQVTIGYLPSTMTLKAMYGDGTQDSPYLVMSLEDLQWLSNSIKKNRAYDGLHFQQVSDIEGMEETVGVGLRAFTGIYDGFGYSVKVNLNCKNRNLVGMFSYNDGTITNVQVSGEINGSDCVGAVCGYNDGEIYNCCNLAQVNGIDEVGGICGYNTGDIRNSSSYALVKGTKIGKAAIGAICGANDNNDGITECYWDKDTSGCKVGVNGETDQTIGYTTEECQNGKLLDILNEYVNKSEKNRQYFCRWAESESKYPVLSQGTFFNCELLKDGVHIKSLILEASKDYSEEIDGLDAGNYTVKILYLSKQEKDFTIDKDNTKATIIYDPMDKSLAILKGRGESTDPYLIYSADEMRAVSKKISKEKEDFNTKVFKQEGDVRVLTKGLGLKKDYAFTGTYDGSGYTIQVDINGRDKDVTAVFEYNSGTIKNVNVAGKIVGDKNIAGVCGYNQSKGTLEICNNYAEISAGDGAGGVCFDNSGTITKSGNIGKLSAENIVGGISALSEKESSIQDGYNIGELSGHAETIGGICGNHLGIIDNCYSSMTIQSKNRSQVGGICGVCDGTIKSSFMDVELYGGNYVGRFIAGSVEAEKINNDECKGDLVNRLGENWEKGRYNYPEIKENSSKGFAGTMEIYREDIRITTREINQNNNYSTNLNHLSTGKYTVKVADKDDVSRVFYVTKDDTEAVLGYIPSDREIMVMPGNGTQYNPYLVSSLSDLKWLGHNLNAGTAGNFASAYYKQTEDIGSADNALAVRIGHDNKVNSSKFYSHFYGYYDGDNHNIEVNIYCSDVIDSQGTTTGVGLFGYNCGVIENVFLLGNIASETHKHVGGICGDNAKGKDASGKDTLAEVRNCCNSAEIRGPQTVGGICAYNRDGSIKNCYNTNTVNGGNTSGGICGYVETKNYEIKNCYSYGEIIGNNNKGGICGYGATDSGITNTYWDKNASKCDSSYGGDIHSKGYTTGECKGGKLLNDLNDYIQKTDNSLKSWKAGENNYPTFDKVQKINIVVLQGDTAYDSGELSAQNDYTLKTDKLLSGKYTVLLSGLVQLSKDFTAPVDNGNVVIRYDKNDESITVNFGLGTEKDPYLVSTISDLEQLSKEVGKGNSYKDKFFAQIENISNIDFAIGYDDDHSFKGTYDGLNHTVDLSISNEDAYAKGFFGYNEGKIKNLSVSGNITSTDNVNIGGVCGVNGVGGHLENCSNLAKIKTNDSGTSAANGCVGGLCGENSGTVSLCKNESEMIDVKGQSVGGICGHNTVGNRIVNCCNSGNIVAEDQRAGGICGYNAGRIENSYNLGDIKNQGKILGGVCGEVKEEKTALPGVIENCYNKGAVNSQNEAYAGGVCGYNNFGKVNVCYWDKETSLCTSGIGKIEDGKDTTVGYTTNECTTFNGPLITSLNKNIEDKKRSGTYCDWKYWKQPNDEAGYPGLFETTGEKLKVIIETLSGSEILKKTLTKDKEDEFYTASISTLTAGKYRAKVNNKGQEATKEFTLAKDNATITVQYKYDEMESKIVLRFGEGSKENPYLISSVEDLKQLSDDINAKISFEGKFFSQIADIESVDFVIAKDEGKPFNGTYDGNRHTMTLSMQSTSGNLGLFGYNSGTIKNLTVLGSLNGEANIGSICVYNSGTIDNCNSDVGIKGTNNLGGICSTNSGTVVNCYNAGSITGTGSVLGGICALNSGTLRNSYNSGFIDVGNDSIAGGICGTNNKDKTISNCYSIAEFSNAGANIGGVCGKNESGNVNNSYWNKDYYSSDSSGATGYNTEDCRKKGILLTKLNDGRSKDVDNEWSTGLDGYPVLSEIDSNVSVLDSNGKTWAEGEIKKDNKYTFTVNNKDIKPGEYILRIATLNREKKIKIAKEGEAFTVIYVPKLDLLFKLKGMGTSNNPCRIGSDEELQNFKLAVDSGNSFEGKYFRQIESDETLNLNEKIGRDFTNSFKGEYNGRSNGVSLAIKGDKNVGMFACNEGTILNLYTEGNVEGKGNVGGICGDNLSSGVIKNSYNKATVSTIMSKDCNIGGICGNNAGKILNTYNIGKIKGEKENNKGSVCGNNKEDNTKIESCFWDKGVTECEKGIGIGKGEAIGCTTEEMKGDGVLKALNDYVDYHTGENMLKWREGIDLYPVLDI